MRPRRLGSRWTATTSTGRRAVRWAGQPRRHRRQPALHHRPPNRRRTCGRRRAHLLDEWAERHDRAGQPRRHRRQPEVHHRRHHPERGGGRRLSTSTVRLGSRARAAVWGGLISTAQTQHRGSSRARTLLSGWRSTAGTSTGLTTATARSAGRTSTARALTRASSPAPQNVQDVRSTASTSTGQIRARLAGRASTAQVPTRASSQGASGTVGVAVDEGPRGIATPSAGSVSFGTQPLGTLSAAQGLDITNTGHGNLQIDAARTRPAGRCQRLRALVRQLFGRAPADRRRVRADPRAL